MAKIDLFFALKPYNFDTNQYIFNYRNLLQSHNEDHAVSLISALAAISTAEFCDDGAKGNGHCEGLRMKTFCVGQG